VEKAVTGARTRGPGWLSPGGGRALGLGLFLSLRSIPLIQEKGDKDYAYSGLVLNTFFILLYIFSLIYLLFLPST